MILYKQKNRPDYFAYVVGFYSIQQLCYGFYQGLNRPLPSGLALLSMILLYWFIAIWISEDVKITGVTWVSASRFGLFAIWSVLVPVYLFETRKLKAFHEILCFFAFGFFFKLIGVMTGKMAIA